MLSFTGLDQNSSKLILHYFKPIQNNRHHARYSDYVIAPDLPHLKLDNLSNEAALNEEFIEQMRFANTTIRMLKNAGHKVYPLFLLSEPLDESVYGEKISSKLAQFSLSMCRENILNEKQYIPTFHFVGHGSPDGIGTFSVSPENFAEKLAKTFESLGLESLSKRQIRFKFHICNGAYVHVNESMSRIDILNSVYRDSFIGRFNEQMNKIGYKDIEVIGYRGYYCGISSNGAASFVINDAPFNTGKEIGYINAEYTIKKQKCTTQALSKYLSFPVGDLEKSFSKLKI